MEFKLDPLPYELDALEPHIGAETVDTHYNKHHKGYVSKLNDAVKGTQWADSDLAEIVRNVDDTKIFNNAAQTWNHTFYWHSMRPPSKSGAPGPLLAKALESDFGGLDGFREKFAAAAIGQFGSGWAWLVVKQGGGLAIVSTSDADNPMRDSSFPLLTADVWEHAYYLDYKNERPRYVAAFLDHLVNWEFAEANMQQWLDQNA
ncbi:MAG: superoxide dismutase [Gammaproteobacteria bacterium]